MIHIFCVPGGGNCMTLRHLRIFVTVVENDNNLTKSAKALYTSQPAVSLAIHEMEEYYGVRLFDRLGRRLYLTEAGRQCLVYARRILSLSDDCDESMKSWNSAGVIRVGASSTIGAYLMPAIAAAFHDRRPQTRLFVKTAVSRELEKNLLVNDLDLALVEIPVHESVLRADIFMKDTLAVIAPQQYTAAEHGEASLSERGKKGGDISSMSLEELVRHPFLLREKGSGTRKIFDDALANQGYTVDPVWECGNTETILQAVAQGAGFSVVPRIAAEASLSQGKVICVDVPELELTQNFYIVRHRDKILSPGMEDFMEIVKAGFGQGGLIGRG